MTYELVWETEDWKVWSESDTPGPTPSANGGSAPTAHIQIIFVVARIVVLIGVETYFVRLSNLTQASATARSGSEPGKVVHPAFSTISFLFHESALLSASRFVVALADR